MDDLEDIGRRLAQDLKQNKFNTKRISKNLPYIERKLDIVANDYNYTLNFPAKVGLSSTFLNLYFKPDNCCDCFTFGGGEQRSAIVDISGWDGYVPYEGTQPPVGAPIEGEYSGPMSDGTEFKAVLTNLRTETSNKSPWHNSPWFHPFSDIEFDYENNQYGDTLLTSVGVVTPVNGFYLIRLKVTFLGVTTATSKVTVYIKQHDPETDTWSVVATKIYSVEYGSFCWDYGGDEVCASYGINGSFSILADFYAVCAPIIGEISAFIKAENVLYFTPSTGEMSVDLMGLGPGALRGQVTDRDTGVPLEAATVKILGRGSAYEVTTDADGMYYMYDVQPGSIRIEASSTNYTTVTVNGYIEFNEVTIVDIGLPHV